MNDTATKLPPPIPPQLTPLDRWKWEGKELLMADTATKQRIPGDLADRVNELEKRLDKLEAQTQAPLRPKGWRPEEKPPPYGEEEDMA